MQVLEEYEGFNFLAHGRTVQNNFKHSIQNDCDCIRILQCEKRWGLSYWVARSRLFSMTLLSSTSLIATENRFLMEDLYLGQ